MRQHSESDTGHKTYSLNAHLHHTSVSHFYSSGSNFMQALACLCHVAAIFEPSLDECAAAVDCIADAVTMSVAGCMLVQIDAEIKDTQVSTGEDLEERNQRRLPALTIVAPCHHAKRKRFQGVWLMQRWYKQNLCTHQPAALHARRSPTKRPTPATWAEINEPAHLACRGTILTTGWF